MILRKTTLVIGNAAATLARDFPLFFNVHGGKAPIRGVILLSHGSDPGSSSAELTVNSNKGSIVPVQLKLAKASICVGTELSANRRVPHGFD